MNVVSSTVTSMYAEKSLPTQKSIGNKKGSQSRSARKNDKFYVKELLTISVLAIICRERSQPLPDVEGRQTEDIPSAKLVKNPYITASDWGWPIDPVGLRYVLNTVYQRYDLPLFIVENGFGAYDQLTDSNEIHDDYRINYLREHIEQMKKAVVEDGVPLIGYTPWGIIDIVSFGSGEMEKRYGMIYVDKDNTGNGTLQRLKKIPLLGTNK